MPFGNSDHEIISYIRYTKLEPAPARVIIKRSYKKFDPQAFLADLSKIDWSEVYESLDVDIASDIFTAKFLSVLDCHAPYIKFQQRKHFCPWISEETKTLMKERDSYKKNYELFAVNGDTIMANTAWQKYKQMRNKINNKKKFEEKEFKARKISEAKDCPTQSWRVAKTFMDWKQSGGPPTQLKLNDRLVSKPSIIASEMNKFFLQKIDTIRQNILDLPNCFTGPQRIMQNKNCRLSFRGVSVRKVNRLLKSLKNSKSTAIDHLDNFCLKIAADIIDIPLSFIINMSIIQEKFPSSWKYSKVIPLHKKLCRVDKNNYRPVSILSPLSKILEKVVYEQVYQYFNKNRLFNANLHGFRAKRSTQTALITMYDRWVQSAASAKLSGAVFLDLSAAFDLVDHKLLLKKLKIYGFDDGALEWIRTYLTNRFQAVWLDSTMSGFLETKVGVPQGSNLGPLFFLIFFNDLPEIIDNHVDCYADDSTLTATADSVEEIGRKLTSDCANVVRWMSENKLKLNAEKTHVLMLGTDQRLRRQESTLQVTIDQTRLEEDPKKCEVLLGCQVQSNLKWDNQVSAVKAKLKKRLTGLIKLKGLGPFSVRKTIAEGIFHSVMVYCLPLYGGMDKGDIMSLQIMQNKAARITSKMPPRCARDAMFDKLGWLTVNQLIAYHSAILVFKIRKAKEPEYLAGLLNRDSRNGRIMVKNYALQLAQRSFTTRGADTWNRIPRNLREQERLRLGAFKKSVKRWTIENIPRFLE